MRKEDINGFWIYENTPLTKEGVFPYKGRQIDSDGSMGLEPNRIYMVYRPAKELTKKDVLESFNGLQFTDEHQMLGKGQRDVGTKRMDGTIYNVHVSSYNKGLVLCTLKVMSEAAKNLISQGKRQLSCGYYCDYKHEEGVFNGVPYQFVQTDLVGNHVALVKKGRMGEQCAVCDSAVDGLANVLSGKWRHANDSAELTDRLLSTLTNQGRMGSLVQGRFRKIACDSAIDINQKELKFMPDNKNDYTEMLVKSIQDLDPKQLEQLVSFVNGLAKDGGAGAAEPTKDADATTQAPAPAPAPAQAPAPAPDGVPGEGGVAPDAPAKDACPDCGNPTQNGAGAPDGDGNGNGDGDVKTFTEDEFRAAVAQGIKDQYAKEDAGRQLAEDLAPRCGNLWKRGMDEDDVANAACEKLGTGKNLPKEAKVPFVKAIAEQAKKDGAGAPVANAKNGMDSAVDCVGYKSPVMARYLKG